MVTLKWILVYIAKGKTSKYNLLIVSKFIYPEISFLNKQYKLHREEMHPNKKLPIQRIYEALNL